MTKWNEETDYSVMWDGVRKGQLMGFELLTLETFFYPVAPAGTQTHVFLIMSPSSTLS